MLLFVLAALGAEQVTVIGGLSVSLDVTPGARRDGAFALRNNTDAPVDVLLTRRDYRFDADGRTEYPEPGAVTGSNSAWIGLGASQVRLPPGEVTEVGWTLAVPADATPGTHWSVVLVEPMGQRFAPRADGRAVGVTTVYRSAIQLVTHVGRSDPELSFLGRQVSRSADGDLLLGVDVGNAGPAWAVPALSVELTGPGGEVRRADEAPRRVFPGTSVRYWVDLGPVPAGTWEALVIADAGGDDVVGARIPVVAE